MLLDLPDPALRQPFTWAALSPLLLSYYALGILAIFPNTLPLKLPLLPYIVWQARRCALELDFSQWLAQAIGLESADRLNFWNFGFVMSMFFMALRTFEWTFTKKPLRRYDIRKGQNAAVVERPLSVSNVLLDGVDLFCNQRGIGWSWSSKPFPDGDIPPVSIGSVVAKLFLKVAAFDASHHIMSTLSPAINQIGGGSIFNPSLSLWPRVGAAAICAICGGVWVYAVIDSMYHIATLIGRIILRQPASHWPPNSHRPWLSTSIHEFWSFRWHQFFRHFFITFGARPGGALLGQPGALIGAFTISATIHYLGMWGLGHGTDFIAAGIFFLFMGLGTVFEDTFKKATGVRVQGMLGWLWTMLWVLVWGMVMVDGWAQRGMFSADFLPEHLRPGKLLVDAISIRLSK